MFILKRQRCLAVLVVAALLMGTMAVFGLVATQPESAQADDYITSGSGNIYGEQWTVNAPTTTASRNSPGPLEGRIRAVHLDYKAGITTTTDITLTWGTPAATILAVHNSATDGWYYPSVQLNSATGATVAEYVAAPVNGRVTALISQTTVATPVITITMLAGE